MKFIKDEVMSSKVIHANETHATRSCSDAGDKDIAISNRLNSPLGLTLPKEMNSVFLKLRLIQRPKMVMNVIFT